MMEEGAFREDLFYRLNVMPIFLPPLRERIDDIPVLAQTFLEKFSEPHSKTINQIDPDCLEAMKKYRWPGNIRELENVIERAFIVESRSVMTLSSLPEQILKEVAGLSKNANSTSLPQNASITSKASLEKEAESPTLDFELFKEQAEKDFIISALKANKGRINQTVAQANIPKNTLLRKIRKYGINVKDYSG